MRLLLLGFCTVLSVIAAQVMAGFGPGGGFAALGAAETRAVEQTSVVGVTGASAAEPQCGDVKSTRPVAAASSATAPLFSDAEWGHAPGTTPAAAEGGSLWSIGISVLVVAGLAMGLGWLVKRTGLRKFIPGSGGHMQVVDRLALGRRRSLLLVRCGDRVFLIGDHEHGLSGCGEMPVNGISELVFDKQLRAAQHPGLPS